MHLVQKLNVGTVFTYYRYFLLFECLCMFKDLRVKHVVPVYPALHLHLKPVAPSLLHWPPFLHGESLQGSSAEIDMNYIL